MQQQRALFTTGFSLLEQLLGQPICILPLTARFPKLRQLCYQRHTEVTASSW